MLPTTLLSYHFQTSQMADWFLHPWAVAASRWDRPTSSWWGSRSYETRWFPWKLIQRPLLKQHSDLEINIQTKTIWIFFSLHTMSPNTLQKYLWSWEVQVVIQNGTYANFNSTTHSSSLPHPQVSLRRLAKALLAIPTSLVGSKSASLNLLLSLAPRPRT